MQTAYSREISEAVEGTLIMHKTYQCVVSHGMVAVHGTMEVEQAILGGEKCSYTDLLIREEGGGLCHLLSRTGQS